MVEESDFRALSVTFAPAEGVGALPPHHADPFDRMRVARSLVEGATLVTHDRQFRPSDVPILRA
jgi:PIN domain nuclease of toxin-antitoxin system